MSTIADSNVIIDTAARHPKWLEWSRYQVERAARGYDIVNRDPSGFETYYPTINLIKSETHP